MRKELHTHTHRRSGTKNTHINSPVQSAQRTNVKMAQVAKHHPN